MIRRIKTIKPMPDYILLVSFDDGKKVLYDVKDDFNLLEYSSLQSINGLFNQVQLDESRTCVFGQRILICLVTLSTSTGNSWFKAIL